MSTILSSHPETSIWSAPSAPQKLHSRSRETETACCAGVSITKSLECIEIPQCIYESCDGLGLLSKDPIGFGGGDTNLYRMTGNHPNMATDPSGLWEKPPYVGPSLDILNKHKAAGGLNYELRTVSRSELDDLNRAGLVSEYAYRDAQDLLPLHSRVEIAVSQRLHKGVNALEAGARIHGTVEMVTGACEATVGGVMCFTPAYPAGIILLGHGGDHAQAGFGGLVTGIDQDTFVASGAQYVGKNGLGLSDEGAKALGRITEFGTDIAAPAVASRMMYLRGLGQSTAYASNFDTPTVSQMIAMREFGVVDFADQANLVRGNQVAFYRTGSRGVIDGFAQVDGEQFTSIVWSMTGVDKDGNLLNIPRDSKKGIFSGGTGARLMLQHRDLSIRTANSLELSTVEFGGMAFANDELLIRLRKMGFSRNYVQIDFLGEEAEVYSQTIIVPHSK